MPVPTSAMSIGRAEATKPSAFEFVGVDLTLLCITRDILSGEKSSPSVWGCGKAGGKHPRFWPEDGYGVSTGFLSNTKHPHFPLPFDLKGWCVPRLANDAGQTPLSSHLSWDDLPEPGAGKESLVCAPVGWLTQN